MNTKEKILNAALMLFSEKGYTAVSVGEIAEAVGIKAPSLYKHYKSKKDIFNAILAEMQERYDAQSTNLNMNGSNAKSDADLFSVISEDELVKTALGLFHYFLHDDYVCKFRKMLTFEQFHNTDLSKLYSKHYADGPISYQSAIFSMISAGGCLKQSNSKIMALQFYAPIYLLLTVCDRQPERESEAIDMIEEHIRQFNKLYRQERF